MILHSRPRRKLLAIATSGIAALAVLVTGSASAQLDYPSRPIRLIYGFPPGSDGAVRIIADKLSEAFGKPVVVENVTGAAGGIAADRVAKAAPDGYTLGALASANIVINSSIYAKLPYDPIKDLTPVTQIFGYPNVLTVNNDVPVQTVRELIDFARANPGKLTFGHSGIGTTQHLGGELMKSIARIEMQQVPYRGPPQIAADLMGGRITMSFLSSGAPMQLVREGKLRALAVTSRARAPFAPDLPTMIESGFPNFDMTPWFGVFVPAGTPQTIVERLNKEIVRIVATPDMVRIIDNTGVLPLSNTPEEFAALIRAEAPYWAELIKELGIAPIE